MASNPSIRFYGNTKAQVLNYDRAGSFADVLANRVLSSREKQITRLPRLLEVDDYRHNKPASCMEPSLALRQYRGFNKLFGERLHASKYPSTTSDPKIVNFMELPGEIRNRVYRLLLVVEPAIEFCPKMARASRNGPGRLYRHCEERWSRKLKPMLRFLRLSKAINAEASDIFYGENEFRFTNQEGWTYLEAFLTTIGKVNTTRLRHVTVHVPWGGRDASNDRSSPHRTSYLTEPELLETYTLQPIGLVQEWASYSPNPAPLCLKLLEDAGTLTRLDLILPFTFELDSWIRDNDVPDLPFHLTTFENLRVSIIHLVVCHDWDVMHSSQQPMVRLIEDEDGSEYGEAFSSPKGYAQVRGWDYKVVEYDEKGRY